jgi:hypothetical protein
MGSLHDMLKEPLTISKVLDEHTYKLLTASVQETEFKAIPLGAGVKMYATEAPQEVTETVLSIVSKAVGKKLKTIAMFVRYNDELMDTSTRIHSDGEVLGGQPTVACVLYLNDGSTGTALWSHLGECEPCHEWAPKVYTEEDDDWGVMDYAPQIANSMFIYNARQFHSRYPHQADGPRFTLVGFFKEMED